MQLIKYGFGVVAVLLVWLLLATTQQSRQTQTKAEPEIPFDQMTPSQHLARARSIMQVEDPLELSKDQIEQASRHLLAIPESAPESKEAVAFQKESLEAARTKFLERLRGNYAAQLQAQLREQGFDIVVTELGDRLIIADDLFKDEVNRIQFLANTRKMANAKGRQGLCDMGFRRVTIGPRGLLSDTYDYSLGCKASANVLGK